MVSLWLGVIFYFRFFFCKKEVSLPPESEAFGQRWNYIIEEDEVARGED